MRVLVCVRVVLSLAPVALLSGASLGSETASGEKRPVVGGANAAEPLRITLQWDAAPAAHAKAARTAGSRGSAAGGGSSAIAAGGVAAGKTPAPAGIEPVRAEEAPAESVPAKPTQPQPIPAEPAETKAVAAEPVVTAPPPASPFEMRVETRRPTDFVTDPNARGQAHSIARVWNEMMLFAIRRDLARPTIHARNLYHTSAAMWDAWAAYDAVADQVIHHEKRSAADPGEARRVAISYAVLGIIRHRFQSSIGADAVLAELDTLMLSLGLDPAFTGTTGDSPAALGNRIAASYIAHGLQDGSNEAGGYANLVYQPVNPPLLVDQQGNPDLIDPDRWQPLALTSFVDQNGNPIPSGYPPFLSPEWGHVEGFALRPFDLDILTRDGEEWPVWHNPGPPPMIGEPGDRYKWGFEMVATWSSHLDPADGVMWDVSPNAIGNTVPLPSPQDESTLYDRTTGAHGSQGYSVNPVTGEPYPQQIVPRGDYTRILAEFWADGPSSETPPGHWFTITNYVMDHPAHERRFMGVGPELDALEYDVKAYLALGGTLHDVAISAWSIKGAYDYIRPVSALRFLADAGQCSDPTAANYNPEGINLAPGLIELVSAQTTQPGERHAHLAGSEGKIAIRAWRGPTVIFDPDTDTAGVGWILAENWWPYQRPTFVSPPFAGYISGHSTFSRAAAELLTLFTGSPYFPGGLGEFVAPQNEYLVFEQGPSIDVRLQWASYRDASDQCSLSRIWGGIHPPADDLPGRFIGQVIGPDAFVEARRYFDGLKSCPADYNRDTVVNALDVAAFVAAYTAGDPIADTAPPFRELNFFDVVEFLDNWSVGCP